MALGFLTRLMSFLFVFDMIGAIMLVGMKKGFGGYELEFLLLVSSLALSLAGAGRYSLDAQIARRVEIGR